MEVDELTIGGGRDACHLRTGVDQQGLQAA